MPDRLIIFTRFPHPGRCKTRLIPFLGPEGAASLQKQLCEFLLKNLGVGCDYAVEIRCCGAGPDLFRHWLGEGLACLPQGEGSLGERMFTALRNAFSQQAQKAVIIGSDTPQINSAHIRTAFDALTEHDLVLGPARDGGYYLVGMKEARQELFAEIEWGSQDVLIKTLQKARNLGLKTYLLETLQDIDNAGDLTVWQEIALKKGGAAVSLSIVIPTLNEEDCLEKTLELIPPSPTTETLVVDGGSIDNTANVARGAGAQVLTDVPGGRAGQMNVGALLARGEVLLFLHGDTLLPEGFREEIKNLLSSNGVAAGAFRLRIGDNTGALGVVAAGANFRSKLFAMPYGDQALFLRRQLFWKQGGFPCVPFMEDFALLKNLRKSGKIAISSLAVTTSPRRWRQKGVLKTTLINQGAVLAYYLGVAPQRIANFYRACPRSKAPAATVGDLDVPQTRRFFLCKNTKD